MKKLATKSNFRVYSKDFLNISLIVNLGARNQYPGAKKNGHGIWDLGREKGCGDVKINIIFLSSVIRLGSWFLVPGSIFHFQICTLFFILLNYNWHPAAVKVNSMQQFMRLFPKRFS